MIGGYMMMHDSEGASSESEGVKGI